MTEAFSNYSNLNMGNVNGLLFLYRLPEDYQNERHMSLCVRKPTIWILTWSDTNQAVQLLKMARGLILYFVVFWKKRYCTIQVAKLICVFVFAYANRWFSRRGSYEKSKT